MARRRELLKAGLACAVAAALPACARTAAGDAAPAGGAPLKILVLGGTGFLGPHFVAAARARGHALTLFNRGKSNPGRFEGEAFADIEQLRGDRKLDLSALGDSRRWDAVLDTSAYIPADVTRSAQLLAKRVDRYLIVSTISVYARTDTPGQDEAAPLATLVDPTATEVTGETYGGLKALCEHAAQAGLPGRTMVVRPGLIVGPGDTTDRFTYWPARADRGGEILAPGSADDPTQFIDVRDLADFLLLALEKRYTGIVNADAPAGSITMGRLLSTCQAVSRRMNTIQCVRAPCPQPPGHDSTLTWVPADFLEAQGVSAWQDMPAWIPAEGDYAGFGRISTARAQALGLRTRPLDDTVAATLEYWRSLPDERRAQPKAGLSPAREATVLQAWHARG
ncbi:NAD-dependent epimerase/dehydratase family protein [Luteimonas sp. MC1825]|uniref:NAD-dependent epimerase/dehydratase family protein n=1 Tax=Luteimonas sp. MC1825 TaxID=2761107 RepID=UPI001620C9A9|nr:NAD-dependent epimerase/dehydratase family protein [Luteimonas sp. MC1825]MBB6598509.1 NAD-dependent epimerase/dehydratase family protein [Luteimonas sp. MC1825]QOC88700.1 NAD-dependent epimerase/dehydratase family protein [Luteimonas sp. MC1825]